MPRLSVSLFGTFQAQLGGRPITGWESAKVQELIAFLLVNRDKPHSRESLSTLLWGEQCTTAQARSYLRKAVWQVQQGVDDERAGLLSFLTVGNQYMQANSCDDLFLDVEEFEAGFEAAKDIPGRALDSDRARRVAGAVSLYRGDLLEGLYADWCTYRRERFKHMYLLLLDKLIGHHESRAEFDSAIACGDVLLVHDVARERTHRHMMRLHYANGDRTSALRQFEKCRALLRSELDVEPGPLTIELYERIKEGVPPDDLVGTSESRKLSLDDPECAADCLVEVREDLARIRTRIDRFLSAS